MNNRLIIVLMGWICVSLTGFAQHPLLQSGPMPGYAEMREAMVWVQTTEPAQVHLSYYDQEAPQTVFETEAVQTRRSDAFTAHLLCDQVVPGKTYHYDLYINQEKVRFSYPTQFQTPPNWLFRSEPPDLKIVLGSCAHIADSMYDRPGPSYSGEYHIFQSMARHDPDLMLWLGDNVYYREADWYSRTGMLYRNTHTRKLPEMQELLAKTNHYAVWDDHDYGPNNSDGSFARKDLALETFRLFWANPSYGVGDIPGAISMFEWGDAHFFMLDNRYHRSPNRMRTRQRTMLGKAQLDWLIEALVSSPARFKFVMIGGQVLNSVEAFENYANVAPEERRYLLQMIIQERIRNVIFLTGDRHHSELSQYEQDGITIYDFTVSPLTSGSYDAEEEPNGLRVPGSQVGIRNYGTIDLVGPSDQRKAKMTLFDPTGKELWSFEVTAK